MRVPRGIGGEGSFWQQGRKDDTSHTVTPHAGDKACPAASSDKGGSRSGSSAELLLSEPNWQQNETGTEGPGRGWLSRGAAVLPRPQGAQEEFRKCISVKICCCPATGVPARAGGATSAQKHPYKACTAHPRGGEKCHISPPWALQPLSPSGWAGGHGDRGDTDGKGSWHRRHRCKKLQAPFSIIMLPPGKLLVLGCPPSSQCLRALPRDTGM